ncbi:glycosyltransferase [Sporosarcina sp. P21c]|uniref:glycosyltransferase n=1 Tax=Sporosarcina sp. P21c TaxID=2048255 RepID=UPI0013043E93|nr:glycosyltransferase [Sporosarcina sp. P21c]
MDIKKKIAIIIPSLRGGGAERVFVNITNNIDPDKFNVRLIVIKKEGPYVKLLKDSIDVVDLKSGRVRYSLIKLVKALNEFRPDIVISTLGHLNLMLIGLKPLLKSNPKILVREASTPSKSLTELPKNKKRIFKFLYKSLYPKANIIIAQCEEMKNDIIKSFSLNESKVKYIYNPLDILKIKTDGEKENPYMTEKINIIAVGRLTYAKGFDILIESFKIVMDRIPNAQLTILGNGELKESLVSQIKKLNLEKNISLIEFQENPYPYFFYADTFVLSSRWEGFPNTLLEALACNVKVVSTECKSGPREIIGNNEYGILVPTEDSEKLAQGIISSINSKRNSRERAKEFEINKIVKEYEELFMNC